MAIIYSAWVINIPCSRVMSSTLSVAFHYWKQERTAGHPMRIRTYPAEVTRYKIQLQHRSHRGNVGYHHPNSRKQQALALTVISDIICIVGIDSMNINKSTSSWTRTALSTSHPKTRAKITICYGSCLCFSESKINWHIVGKMMAPRIVPESFIHHSYALPHVAVVVLKRFV